MALSTFNYQGGAPIGRGPLSVNLPAVGGMGYNLPNSSLPAGQQQAFAQQHPFAPTDFLQPSNNMTGQSFAVQNQAANLGLYQPGGFGAQAAQVNAPAPVMAPGAQIGKAPAVPNLSYDPMMPPGVTPVSQNAALDVYAAKQQAQQYAFQQHLADRGISMSTEGRTPGDVAQAAKAYENAYNAFFGGGPSQAPQGVQAFAPSGLRERAIAAGGAPVAGVGDVQVSASPQAGGGYNFMLKQGVQPSGAAQPAIAPVAPPSPGQVSPAAMEFLRTGVPPTLAPTSQKFAPPPQQAVAPKAQTPYEKSISSIQSGLKAPSGEIFRRDAKGHLQQVGYDPELAAKAEAMKEEAKSEVTQAAKMLDTVQSDAESANLQNQNIKRVRELYEAGATSGFGQEALTAASAALSRITGNTVKVSNQQELEKNIGQLALEQQRLIAKGQGSVSNYERELFQQAQANKTLTKEANLQILQALDNINQRRIALQNERVRLEGMNVPSAQIAKEIRAYNQRLTKQADEQYGPSGQRPTGSLTERINAIKAARAKQGR